MPSPLPAPHLLVYPRVCAMLKRIEAVHKRTMRVVRLIPPDKLDWSPKPDVFTFGELARHIPLTNRRNFAELLVGNASTYTSDGPEHGADLTRIVALSERCHHEVSNIVATLTDAELDEQITSPTGDPITRSLWLDVM